MTVTHSGPVNLWAPFPNSLAAGSAYCVLRWAPQAVANPGTAQVRIIDLTPSVQWSSTPTGAFNYLRAGGVLATTVDATGLYSFNVMASTILSRAIGDNVTPMFSDTWADYTTHEMAGGGHARNPSNWQGISFLSLPTYRSVGGGHLDNVYADTLTSRPCFQAWSSTSALTIARRTVVRVQPFDTQTLFGKPHTGRLRVRVNAGVVMEAGQRVTTGDGAGQWRVDLNAAVVNYCDATSAETATRVIHSEGTADSGHVGGVRIGDCGDPSAGVHISPGPRVAAMVLEAEPRDIPPSPEQAAVCYVTPAGRLVWRWRDAAGQMHYQWMPLTEPASGWTYATSAP